MAGEGFAERLDTDRLSDIAGQYPWFAVAVREVCIRKGMPVPAWLSLSDDLRPLLISQRAAFFRMQRSEAIDFIGLEESEDTRFDLYEGLEPYTDAGDTGQAVISSMDLIDGFIARGDRKIVVRDDTPDSLGLENSGLKMDFDDDMISEEMARIYMSQGLTGCAVEIYERLSLLNPEKSVYFAEVIARAKGSAKESN